jgi:hypothetical protein
LLCNEQRGIVAQHAQKINLLLCLLQQQQPATEFVSPDADDDDDDGDGVQQG